MLTPISTTGGIIVEGYETTKRNYKFEGYDEIKFGNDGVIGEVIKKDWKTYEKFKQKP